MSDNNVKTTENEVTTVQPEVKNEVQQNTETNTAPVYEEYDSHEVAKKPRKKFKKRYIALALVVLLIGYMVVKSVFFPVKKEVFVTTEEVTSGSIENILSISGTVQSAESKTYFSDVTGPVAEVNFKVGDKVKAGDVLCTYDADALNLSKQSAELGIKQAQGTYSSYFSGTAAADRKYTEGMTPAQINERLDAITAQIDALNNQITEKTSRVNQTIKDIQNTMQDINQNGIGDSYEAYFDRGNNEYITRTESGAKEDGSYKEPTEQDRQMALALQQTLTDTQYALNNDEEIKAWKDQITALQEEQQHLQSGKAAQLNPGSTSAAKAQKESTELTNNDTIAKIDEALQGIKADFNGVVTNVSVVEGGTVAAGAQMITLANTDDVEVAISVSKSDLAKISEGMDVDITINNNPYKGKISKISGNATKNNNGVAVVETIIEITNPDSNIILGVEANNKIHAQKADDTIVLPYEYIMTDSDGDYVYVVENGLVTRRNVTVGISSSTQAQIVDGLSIGEKVISADFDSLMDGMAVSIAQ
jgi:RND family efflux transporter MFP subunit